MKILANDGISSAGQQKLEAAGYTVITNKVEQGDLARAINENQYEILLVRSATTARKDLIDACPDLKLIGRGGVGMDNIDVDYARHKGTLVVNTPAASSQSVAELVMAHLFSISRFMHQAHRDMPISGSTDFSTLKKKYAKGVEARGKVMGIIGFGRIGQCVAKYALGAGMEVLVLDHAGSQSHVEVALFNSNPVRVEIVKVTMDELLAKSDYISLHIPAQTGGPVISHPEFAKMKDGVRLINAARGGVVDETALIEALDSGKVSFAALDVFVNEPNPRPELLSHPKISSTPHIGAATGEAQARIGLELADIIIAEFGDRSTK